MKHALGKIFDSYETMDHELAQDEKYRMPYLKNFVCYYISFLIINLYIFIWKLSKKYNMIIQYVCVCVCVCVIFPMY